MFYALGFGNNIGQILDQEFIIAPWNDSTPLTVNSYRSEIELGKFLCYLRQSFIDYPRMVFQLDEKQGQLTSRKIKYLGSSRLIEVESPVIVSRSVWDSAFPAIQHLDPQS
jgi:hypothetical protein